MAKKRSKPRRRYFRRSKTRRRRDKRLPLSVGIGLGVSVLAPPAYGWTSALDAVKNGRMDLAFQSFVRSWTGIAIGGIGGQRQTYFNLWDTLNPLAPEAPALKATILSGIAMKVAKMLIKTDPLKKVPFVGKYVKFS